MRLRIVSLALLVGTVCVGQQPWRKATPKELNREIVREAESMAKSGLVGDPPCTMGLSLFYGAAHYYESPCALTNGRYFQSEITIGLSDGRECKFRADQVRGRRDAIAKCYKAQRGSEQ